MLNEKEYAEDCLKNGVLSNKPFFTLSIIAKYYYSIGYKKKKIEASLNDFMKEHYDRYEFDEISWRETISSIAEKAKKYKLFEITGVKITHSEFEKISEIHNKVLERLMFTLLCLAKLGNERNEKNNGWVNTDIKDIFSMARISATIYEQDLKINQLYQLGLIEFPKRNDLLNIRVTFIDKQGDEELFVSDFRELGYEYLKYKGEDFIRCQECGILIRQNKNKTKKYCKNCAGYTPQETKKIICVDCGREFEVDSKNNKSCRCDECYTIYRKSYKAEKEQERRDKIRNRGQSK